VIGSGSLPAFARNVLEDHGVVVDEQESAASLPISSVWVDARSGERTILATDNSSVEAEALPGPLLSDGTLAILLDGHYANITRAIAFEAHEKGIPIVLDCGRWRPVYADLLPLASDIIMCATFRPPDLAGADQQAVVSTIHSKWQPELCAMTRGPRSILVGGDDGVAEIPVPAVVPVDTTGAGDVLHGAYLYYRYAAGFGARDALGRAAQLAARSCEHLGVRAVVEPPSR
jgi:sugar/nucleoside kinase (ribokinase family)